MTNYEWLIKTNGELVKDILALLLSKEEGIPGCCSRTCCIDCDFDGYLKTLPCCTDATKKWLDAEHEPLYKKGDIVIDSNDKLAVVKKDECDEDFITISHYADNTIGIEVHVTSIKKKVGHIHI